MTLSQQALKQLNELKDEVEEILAQVADVVPPDKFRCTVIIRYCGDNPDAQEWTRNNLIMTDDAHDDAIAELQWVRDKL